MRLIMNPHPTRPAKAGHRFGETTMTRNLLRAGALGCALLTTTCLTPAPALAQTAPAFRNLDANGVDVVKGDFVIELPEGSIGSGPAELALVRRRGGNVPSQWDGITFHRTLNGTTATIVIGLPGDSSDRFTGGQAATSFTSAEANGATLVLSGYNYIYTAADGTQITFIDPSMSAESGAPPNSFCSQETQSSCFLVPESIVSPNGRTISFTWELWSMPDGSGWYSYEQRLATVSNSFGYSIGFSYAANGSGGSSPPSSGWFRRTQAKFFNNAVSTTTPQSTVGYSYPTSGVVEVTDIGGRVWRFTETFNDINSIRRPGASSDTTTITRSSGIVTQVVRDGLTTAYGRSLSGSTVTTTVTQVDGDSGTTDPQTVIVGNTSTSRISSVTDPLTRQTSFQYDSNDRLERITYPEGNSVGYTHDSRGNVIETRLREKGDTGDTGDDIVSTATFPCTTGNPLTCNQPETVTDARGKTTTFTYDGNHGGILTVTSPAVDVTVGGSTFSRQPQTRYSYTLTNGEYLLTGVSACATGSSPSCVGTSDETRTVISYDARGNVSSVERRSGNTSGTGAISATTAMTYDDVGNRLTVDGPLSGSGDLIRYRYNSARQLEGVIGPDPDGTGTTFKHRATHTTFTNGLPTKVERGVIENPLGAWSTFIPAEAVETEYDSNARPVVQRLTSGTTTYALTQTGYDGFGRVRCVAQRMNDSQFATSSLPASACDLDTEGTFGPDRIARTTYDNAGRATLVETGVNTTAEADEVATAYTNNGRVQHVTDAEGNRTTYEYDGHDRLVKTFFPSPTTDNTSSTTDYEELTLDANGNVTGFRNRANQSIAFTVDDLNRVTLKDLPGSEPDVTYSYDLLGRMTGASHTGHSLGFTFDALGRNLTQTSSVTGTVTSTWDIAGRRTRIAHPDGFYVDQDYNVAGELTAIRENGATSNLGILASFTYDDLGRRATLTRGNGTVTTYGYDAVSRLDELDDSLAGTTYDQSVDFSHNPASQIVGRTGSNNFYAYTGYANINRTDTHNGLNQISASDGTSFTYDAKGNLTTDGTQTFTYSSENLLLTRSPSSGGTYIAKYDPLMRLHEVQGNTGPKFGYDGLNLILEVHPTSGSVLRRYVHGPGVDEPLVWYEGSGTTTRRWQHADERGSIVAISSDTGAAWNINRYDEFGNNNGLTYRFQYTGQAWSQELKLLYYKARFYSPDRGRFLQTDPIGYAAGMNRYSYPSDPVNFRDPLGMDDCGGSCDPVVITGSPLNGPTPPSVANPGCGRPRPTAGLQTSGCAAAAAGRAGAAAAGGAEAILAEETIVITAPTTFDGPCRAVAEFQLAALTPHGDTKGDNPQRRGSGYITEMPGGFIDAESIFIALLRLAGDIDVDLGGITEPTTLAIGQPSGIRLRVGFDLSGGFAPRIDVPAGTFTLRAHESIHFTGGRGRQCPRI
jgi:RHS repeat-associated protein